MPMVVEWGRMNSQRINKNALNMEEFYGSITSLYDNLIVNKYSYTFIKTHTVHDTKNEC